MAADHRETDLHSPVWRLNVHISVLAVAPKQVSFHLNLCSSTGTLDRFWNHRTLVTKMLKTTWFFINAIASCFVMPHWYSALINRPVFQRHIFFQSEQCVSVGKSNSQCSTGSLNLVDADETDLRGLETVELLEQTQHCRWMKIPARNICLSIRPSIQPFLVWCHWARRRANPKQVHPKASSSYKTKGHKQWPMTVSPTSPQTTSLSSQMTQQSWASSATTTRPTTARRWASKPAGAEITISSWTWRRPRRWLPTSGKIPTSSLCCLEGRLHKIPKDSHLRGHFLD